MCTVLLRWNPDGDWPLLLGAVRDEFRDRAWQPPGAYWPESGSPPLGSPSAGSPPLGSLPAGSRLIGGRDRAAGGTWLAVDPGAPAVAAVLNGVRLDPAPATGAPAGAVGVRPSRGGLPLDALRGRFRPEAVPDAGYDGFHLLHATRAGATVWSWDGAAVSRHDLEPGDHIIVNHGIDNRADPLVPHFLPLLRGRSTPDPRPGRPTATAWGDWVELLAGDGIDPDDPRALLIIKPVAERTFASTSACLVALGRDAVRFDFTADPWTPASWSEVPLS